MIDKSDIKMGFWLGIGLIGAFMVWGFLAAAANAAEEKVRGG